MVGICGPVRCVYGIVSICGVGDEHANICQQPGWEAPTDTVCSGVDEGGELRLVGGVEHEEMETGICVHHGYIGQIVVPFQGEAVVFHVRVYGRRLGW